MRLHKSKDKILAGVCRGIADYFNIDVSAVRALMIIFFLVNKKVLLAYILFAILLPEESDVEE